MSWVRLASEAASYLPVMRVQIDHAEEAVVTLLQMHQFCTAPSQLPMCSSPEGWMPENIRDIQGKLPTPAQGRKMPSANDLSPHRQDGSRTGWGLPPECRYTPDPTAWNAKGRADWATEVDRNSEDHCGIPARGDAGNPDRGRD
mgnify:CR=1 FL=1